MSKYKKILVAIDFSPHADEALVGSIELAREFGAELHLAHAFNLPLPLVSADEVAVPTEFFDRAWQSASERLNDEANKASASGLQTTPHLIEGAPAPAIVELAERIEADLIVMGTRGHTGLKHVLLGSVTERTLRLAHCSVLVVKGPRESD